MKRILYISKHIEPDNCYRAYAHVDNEFVRVIRTVINHPSTGKSFGVIIEFHKNQTIVRSPGFAWGVMRKAILENKGVWDIQQMINDDYLSKP